MHAPQQSRPSLATGFRDVDASGDTDACTRCLDLISTIPFFSRVKADSSRIIADALPGRVLDAGCGSGTDLVALANLLPHGCEIIGIDASAALLATARKRTATTGNRCSLARGDILHLPFRDNAIGACRIDRVLQHIRAPDRAIEQLTRVLAPGGILVAFDNDWETFFISLDDQETAGRIRRFWMESFAAGRIGRDLPGIFAECGFTGIASEPRTLVLTDPAQVEGVFDLHHLLERMVQAGELTGREADGLHAELASRATAKTLSAGYTGYLVHGRILP
jgi:ubiquinone/menaquinone biosynthesis C-methylase UbiE